jgi:regulatory protein
MVDTNGGQRDVVGASAGLEQALAVAYSYLNRRECTRAEMRAHLERKGIDPSEIERSISELAEAGQLDDARFARLFVQDKRELEEWGSERIRQVLADRGVEPDVIDDALSDPDGDEIDRAVALLRRRFPSPGLDRRGCERALGMLLRKGYESEVALLAITMHTKGC